MLFQLSEVPTTTQEHFIYDWFNLINPDELADKLGAYENMLKGTKMQLSPANDGITSRSDYRNYSNREFALRNILYICTKENVQMTFLGNSPISLIVIKETTKIH
ncbi:hypothetical protein TNIN_412331 [Trichonephila inaurata madagascariensis]|uniref:Uncharacterized protein n=1 Tax=Trichonephila inaurata madagascariensis TaxID=2747483 RepID=A0A8X7C598_9ARAC|nr:hypothetical protein TNIN_412331 [Trichonephila inaurata madagascariensis]